MLIDFHTHLFPDALAPKALGNLAATSGQTPVTDGTVEGTLQKLTAWGVDGAVALHIATNPRQQPKVNAFALALNGRRMPSGRGLVSFGSVHFENGEALQELERLKEAGIRGIKLHPDYQGFEADDRRLYPLYARIAALGLILVFHAGFDPLSPQHVHATPAMLARVLRDFPGLKMVCAHLGGMYRWDEVEEHLCGKNVYFDTAMTAGFLPPQQAVRIINRHSPERILFGSDCPWQASDVTFRYIDSLPLPAAHKELIFSQNALALLGQ